MDKAGDDLTEIVTPTIFPSFSQIPDTITVIIRCPDMRYLSPMISLSAQNDSTLSGCKTLQKLSCHSRFSKIPKLPPQSHSLITRLACFVISIHHSPSMISQNYITSYRVRMGKINALLKMRGYHIDYRLPE